MKLADLDRHPGGNFPLQLVVRWLDTLTRSPAVTWNPQQLAAAQQAVAEARELLATDVLTLAGRHFPNPSPARIADKAEGIRERIDRVEGETAAAIRAQEAATCEPCGTVNCQEHGTPLAMAPLAGFCRCGVEVALCHPECPHGPRVKYDEPQAPAEHGERLEGALRAARGPSVAPGYVPGKLVAEFGPVEHDPLLQLTGNRCLCARCVKDRQEAQG
jgi:hypothetical protein